jgi:glycosyltransferase involved in cell wall biosynthesis
MIGSYLPGYKAGGPLRTLVNMVERLGDDFEFKIVALDRDLGDTKPYPGIKVDTWNKVGKADVFYMSPGMLSLGGFKKILCSTEYDVVYLNSFFAPYFTIKPLLLRRFRLIPDKPLILAPRGEFSAGALGLKKTKKQLYMLAANVLGLYHDIVWQASSEHEDTDIRRLLGTDVNVVIAPDLAPLVPVADELSPKGEKKRGSLRILFLSRIARMKNLDSALKILEGVKGKIQFDIYGPLEDSMYWAECQKIIERLSPNIEIRFCDRLSHQVVPRVMRSYDLFFLPTLGENFGHVILEALCAGCPVLLSDQTPWRNLGKKGVGWDVPLDEPDTFRNILQRCIDMDHAEYQRWSERAREYGLQVSRDEKTVESNRQLFLNTLKKGVKNNV